VGDSRAVTEAEPVRAAIFEVDGQVVQRVIDYPDVELAFHDLSGASDPVQEAREIALSIQRTPMPLSGPLSNLRYFRHGPTNPICLPVVTTSSSMEPALR